MTLPAFVQRKQHYCIKATHTALSGNKIRFVLLSGNFRMASLPGAESRAKLSTQNQSLLSDASTTTSQGTNCCIKVCFSRTEQEMQGPAHVKPSSESQCSESASSTHKTLWFFQKSDIVAALNWMFLQKKKKKHPGAKRLDIYTSCRQRPNHLVGATQYHGMTLFTSADKLLKAKIQNTNDITSS